MRFSYRDASGQKHEYNRGGFKTRDAAEEHENEIRVGINAAREELRRANLPMIAGTVREFAERWMSTTLRNRNRESGWGTAEGRIKNHLLPTVVGEPPRPFGEFPLVGIRKSHGEELRQRLKEKEGPGASTRNRCIIMGKAILEDAVDEGLLLRNPWAKLSLETQEAPDWDWLRPEEMLKLITTMRTDSGLARWLTEVMLSCRAGLRPSEIAALFVEDCDFDTGILRVRKSLVRGVWDACKSKSSKRQVQAPTDLLAELRRRRRYALLRPPVTVTGKDSQKYEGHLLTWGRGGKHRWQLADVMDKPIAKACEKAGLRRITALDLRHTFASHLRLQGVPLEDIRDLMGHSSYQMTLRYAHIDAKKYAEAAKALEGIV